MSKSEKSDRDSDWSSQPANKDSMKENKNLLDSKREAKIDLKEKGYNSFQVSNILTYSLSNIRLNDKSNRIDGHFEVSVWNIPPYVKDQEFIDIFLKIDKFYQIRIIKKPNNPDCINSVFVSFLREDSMWKALFQVNFLEIFKIQIIFSSKNYFQS
jgi:hypothetical protein